MSAALSFNLQKLLKRLLLTMSKGEINIERQRQRLAGLRDFEPFAAFKRIDRTDTGFVNSV